MARTKQTAKKSTGGKVRTAPRKKLAEAGGIKKAHRWHAGVVALRQVRKLQKQTAMLIPKAPFKRFLREVTQDVDQAIVNKDGSAGGAVGRWTKTGVLLMQEASEAYLIGLLSDANLIAIHGKRKGVQVKDIRLARRITRH